MKKEVKLFFVLILLFGIISCKKKDPFHVNFGYNYFPDEVGKYVIYQVDSFYYDTRSGIRDTFQYQLKERIDSIYMDNLNRPTIRLERYVRYNNWGDWQLRDIWAENKTDRTAEKVEENVRYVKLAFPVHENQIWNGNAQNHLDEWIYRYNFIDLPHRIHNMNFDSVLEVNQMKDENFVKRQCYIEQYARNVGMIYKEAFDVESQSNSDWRDTTIFPKPIGDSLLELFENTSLMERIALNLGNITGFNYTMSIITHGIE